MILEIKGELANKLGLWVDGLPIGKVKMGSLRLHQERYCQIKIIIAPTREPIIVFFMLRGFG